MKKKNKPSVFDCDTMYEQTLLDRIITWFLFGLVFCGMASIVGIVIWVMVVK
jgi:hypothetical protein